MEADMLSWSRTNGERACMLSWREEVVFSFKKLVHPGPMHHRFEEIDPPLAVPRVTCAVVIAWFEGGQWHFNTSSRIGGAYVETWMSGSTDDEMESFFCRCREIGMSGCFVSTDVTAEQIKTKDEHLGRRSQAVEGIPQSVPPRRR
jgi:hypothetical protein